MISLFYRYVKQIEPDRSDNDVDYKQNDIKASKHNKQQPTQSNKQTKQKQKKASA